MSAFPFQPSSILRAGQKYTNQIKSERKLSNAHDQLRNAMIEPRRRAYTLVSEGIIFKNVLIKE